MYMYIHVGSVARFDSDSITTSRGYEMEMSRSVVTGIAPYVYICHVSFEFSDKTRYINLHFLPQSFYFDYVQHICTSEGNFELTYSLCFNYYSSGFAMCSG